MNASGGRPQDLFERQYGQGLLQYPRTFPRLRRWLRHRIRDRFEVTRDAVARLCATPGERRLLDFGCGEGRIARLVADAVPSRLREIVGIDVSPSRVAEAQAHVSAVNGAAPSFRFVVGDESVVEQLGEQGFDIVLCIAVFSQVYDLYGVGRILAGALRPGGHLVAEFANYGYVWHRLRLLRGDVPTVSPAPIELWPTIGWDTGNIHYFSLKSCLRFLQQLGLAIDGVYPTGLLANLLHVRPSLFATGFVVIARKPD